MRHTRSEGGADLGQVNSGAGLSRTEAELTTTLRLGEALWMVGRRSFLVQHRLTQIESDLVYTDWRMVEQAA